MSYRDDMNALYVRAESLERDLERAQAELAELRGQARPRREERESPSGELLSAGRSPFSAPPVEPPPDPARALAASERALAALDSLDTPELESDSGRPRLSTVREFEDAVGRAINLVVPELIARQRGVGGDGSPEQLHWMLDVLVATLREQLAGGPPAGARQWQVVGSVVESWPRDSVLGRLLARLGAYYVGEVIEPA